jgi:hypothetical protein
MHGRWLKALLVTLPLLGWTAASAGCGPDLVDLQETLRVVDVTSGFSPGEKDGQARIVPTISLRLEKVGAVEGLDRVSLDLTFTQPDGTMVDNIFLKGVELGPTGSEPLTIRADTGYSGPPPQTPADLLTNSFFQDVTVRILVRQVSGSWTELYTGTIERRLLGR